MKKSPAQAISEILEPLKEFPLITSEMNDLNFSMDESHPHPRLNAAGLSVDFSRACISQAVLNELLTIAESKHLTEQIQLLIHGAELNNTEQRAAHHTALRLPENLQNRVEVTTTQHEINRISEQLRTEQWRGRDDATITDIVNIGIGGSDLGPRMICHALANYADGPKVHFVANVDPSDLECTLQALSPSNTLIIIS